MVVPDSSARRGIHVPPLAYLVSHSKLPQIENLKMGCIASSVPPTTIGVGGCRCWTTGPTIGAAASCAAASSLTRTTRVSRRPLLLPSLLLRFCPREGRAEPVAEGRARLDSVRTCPSSTNCAAPMVNPAVGRDARCMRDPVGKIPAGARRCDVVGGWVSR